LDWVNNLTNNQSPPLVNKAYGQPVQFPDSVPSHMLWLMLLLLLQPGWHVWW
jgi:hypothetical protein